MKQPRPFRKSPPGAVPSAYPGCGVSAASPSGARRRAPTSHRRQPRVAASPVRAPGLPAVRAPPRPAAAKRFHPPGPRRLVSFPLRGDFPNMPGRATPAPSGIPPPFRILYPSGRALRPAPRDPSRSRIPPDAGCGGLPSRILSCSIPDSCGERLPLPPRPPTLRHPCAALRPWPPVPLPFPSRRLGPTCLAPGGRLRLRHSCRALRSTNPGASASALSPPRRRPRRVSRRRYAAVSRRPCEPVAGSRLHPL